nr:EAL domain-containing protein [uncultured Niameybacter sp.]
MNDIHNVQKTAVNHILAELIDEIEDWLVIYDEHGNIVYINRHAERLSGYSREEILKDPVRTLWSTNMYRTTLKERALIAINENRKFDMITLNRRKDKSEFYLSITLSGVKDETGKIIYYICIGKDITDAKLLHERLHKIKYTDEVTKLPNQAAFAELVYNQVAKEEGHFAIILFDISKMSYINNTYGLATGDILLRKIADRLERVIYKGGTIAKLNSDVFAAIYEEAEDVEEINEFINIIFEQITEPFIINNQELYIEMSVGVSLYPCHAKTAGQLINKVQIALTRAKEQNGKNKVVFYEDYIEDEVKRRILEENDIHQAYKNNEFVVYYQPFIDLQRETLTGMEALLRRKKPNGEIIMPGKFIDLLEELELIEQVGVQVIEDVCAQLRSWIDEGYSIVPISINLSTLQFKNPNLAGNIINILEKYNIHPSLVILEITETTVMKDIEMAQKTIGELRNYGFKIAIDDFGTGYSSLGYLKKFLFDHLKIDISFIKEIVQNPQDRVIVGAIVSIAKALSLQTIAEGIETLDQLEIVQEMGCEMGQGYLWDAPLKPELIQEKYLLKLYK